MAESFHQRVLVILPCHNEAGRVGRVIASVRAALPDAGVAVINDDSSVPTSGEALQAGAVVIPHAVNLGYGAALETGYLYAMQRGYDIVVQMDGDGQHLAEGLGNIIRPIADGSADIVIGSRYLGDTSRRAGFSLRRAGQLLFGGIVFLLTRMKVTDPTSGFQALGKNVVAFFASGIFPCDYPDADVVTMLHIAGFRIREVPVRMASRAGGKSMHSGWRPLYYGIKMLLSIFIVILNRNMWTKWRAAPNKLASVSGR